MRWIAFLIDILFLLMFLNAMFMVPGGPSFGTYCVAVCTALIAAISALISGRLFVKNVITETAIHPTRVIMTAPCVVWIATVGISLIVRGIGIFYHIKKPLI